MRQRITSAMAGLLVLAVALCFYATPLLNIFVAIISAMAVYEVLVATKYIENKALAAICLLFSVFIPFMRGRLINYLFPIICFAFALSLFIVLLIKHNTMHIEQIGFSFFIALCISSSMNCLLLMRDKFNVSMGLFGLLLTLSSAWLSDTGAYFIGSFFGKRKLCPTISPKKTVEGLVGGLVAGTLGNLLVLWLLSQILTMPFIAQYVGTGIRVNYFLVAAISPVLSLLGVLGDLSASIIKRQCKIKDFGYIMPGHGGVLDRFDSVLFVAPMVYICLNLLPLVNIIK